MWCGPGASQCTQCSVKPIHLQPRTYSSIEHVTNIKMTGSESGMWRGHVCIQAQQRRSHRPRYRLLFNATFFGSERRHHLRSCSVIVILRAKRQVCTQVRRWRRQRSRLAAPAFGFTVFCGHAHRTGPPAAPTCSWGYRTAKSRPKRWQYAGLGVRRPRATIELPHCSRSNFPRGCLPRACGEGPLYAPWDCKEAVAQVIQAGEGARVGGGDSRLRLALWRRTSALLTQLR
jgi:hypothetical protein